MPARRRRSTTCCTRTWTSSLRSRRTSSTASRGARTSWRAWARSWRSGNPRSWGTDGYNPRALRPLSLVTRRSNAARALFCALMTGLVAPPAALAGLFAPEDDSGSPNAVKIKTLYLITFILGMIIFFGVEAILIYSLIKFRHRRRGGTPPAQIRGNTPLEVGWTLGAAGILVILAVVTFIFLGGIKNPAGSKPGGYVAEAKESGMKFADEGSASGKSSDAEFAALGQAPPPG